MTAPLVILGVPDYATAYSELLVNTLALEIYHQPSMGGYDQIVAVVPHRDNTITWFQYWLGMSPNTLGYTPTVLGKSLGVSWVEEGFWYTVAHELYHSITNKGHCQSSGNGYWDSQHSIGDACGLIALPSWPAPCIMHADYLDIYHFQSFNIITNNWICPVSYANLAGLSSFSNNADPEVLFVSGIVFSNDTVILQPFYDFSNGFADLESGNAGNYTLRFIDANQYVLSDFGFNMTFDLGFEVTGFGFAVQYPVNASKIQLLHEGTIIASRDISTHPPMATLAYPDNGERARASRVEHDKTQNLRCA